MYMMKLYSVQENLNRELLASVRQIDASVIAARFSKRKPERHDSNQGCVITYYFLLLFRCTRY